MQNHDDFERGLPFYPFGTQYYRAPTPLPAEWEGDLREIARCGYTHVQYRPQWRWHERLRGRPCWDDLDRLFDLAARVSLRVILKPLLETAPDWVYDELGGARVGFGDRPIPPYANGAYYVGGRWPCFDHPEVRDAARGFIEALVRRYREHPALWFYNAWNEPRSPLAQCRCPHSLARYRVWLEARYGSLEAMNAALGKAWTSWESLRAPESALDYTEMYLWRSWAGEAVADHVRLVADTLRRLDPQRMVMCHVGASRVKQDVAADSCDDLSVASVVDRYGTSFGIPQHPRTPMEHAQADLVSDWLRRVDGSYWCQEFYANHANWCLPPTAEGIRRQAWMAIAGGAAGFTFWQYRSERVGHETNGWGMREISGAPTLRSAACDEIAAVLKTYGRQLAGSVRTAPAAGILYSRESDMILRVQELRDRALEHATPTTSYAYKRFLQAAHTLLLLLLEDVAFVIPDDDFSALPLLYVPATEMVDAALASRLRDYVGGGGRLVVEFPFACRDENTWVSMRRPSQGLEELLGCREAERLALGEEAGEHVTFDGSLPLQARGWRIVLDPCGGTPCALWSDGTVAAVRHAYGRGEVLALGAGPAGAFRDRWDDPALEVMAWLLAGCDLKTKRPDQRRVWRRRRTGPDGELWFLFNLAGTAVEVSLPCRPRSVWHAPSCDLREKGVRMPPGGTWVAAMPQGAGGGEYVATV